MPPYRLQQWIMRRQVLVIDNDELAFSKKLMTPANGRCTA
jgi:hypothetical protein